MTCSVTDCDRAVFARGMCNSHYKRMRRHGDPNGGRPWSCRGTLHERFNEKVIVSDGCWSWRGSKSNGYAVLGDQGKVVYAHRVSYERFVGPIPESFEIDHLCRNRECTRPEHLEAVPGIVNRQRANAVRWGTAVSA